ncbi:LysO family transporter [Candidatus Caldatribacterium sp. SIUC1]|uniref:LysO family transporter n=1 Tax=Candidatus Caldatribacterium sp. SIUC1 TaxID=3418365 RepID=UPI003F68BCEC
MMWLLLVVLALGFFVGKLVQSDLAKGVGKTLSAVGLLFLLFAMGVRLGQEGFLRMKLASFGLLALSLAFATGAGSVVVAGLAERMMRRKRP